MTMTKRFKNALNLAFIWLLIFGSPGPLPAQAESGVRPPVAASPNLEAGPAPARTTGRKLRVANSETMTLAALQAQGAQQLADYDSFSLWHIASTNIDRFASLPGVTDGEDMSQLYLRGNVLDTRQVSPPVPAQLTQRLNPVQKQFWLLQMLGPVKADWLAALQKSGLELVSYVPDNAFIVWGSGEAIQKGVALAKVVEWNGAYHPAYRLAPALYAAALGKTKSAANTTVNVTVQLYTTPQTSQTLANLQTLSRQTLRNSYQVLNFTNIVVELPTSSLADVANWVDVFNIEPWHEPAKHDEVQNQINAGNISLAPGNRIVPSAPGYLGWLTGKNFPANPAEYPIVAVVDDGVDDGTANPKHPDFHEQGVLANPSRLVFNVNCSAEASGSGTGGHGNINAGIVGAYNAQTDAAAVDAQGYNRGLGVVPFGRLGSIKIFGPNFGTPKCSGQGSSDYARIAQVAYTQANGSPVLTSQSWGSDSGGGYDVAAQEFDALTRDASLATPGNQEMLHVFSAGNAGPGSSTIGSPGTAKNVLTAGATENVRDDGILDGCYSLDANNADDIADFSSRGPTLDYRTKPDIVAPGVHIQGPASQASGYNATGVCGGLNNNSPLPYYPNLPQNGLNQTLYTWSTGTSHSAPAVAGAAALVYNYYKRVLAPGQNPSPAMLKALLLNTPRYLNGLDSGGTLPHPNQGWGGLSLARLVEGTPYTLLDQSVILTQTGQLYTHVVNVADNTKPVHFTLAWTDAPGSTVAASYVNDLDLEVLVNGRLYRGNNFTSGLSVAGGQPDRRNNVENIFLPAGTSGTVVIRVRAANLVGDGVPHLGTLTDQDFALAGYNTTPANPANALPGLESYSLDDITGNNNGVIEPGETVRLNVALRNAGSGVVTGVTSSLGGTSGITVTSGSSAYSDIASGAVATNTTPYILQLANTLNCNQALVVTQTVNYTGGSLSNSLVFNTGNGQYNPVGIANWYTSTNWPHPIADTGANTVRSYLTVPGSGDLVGKLRVKVNLKHTFVGDLTIRLIAPDGTVVTLANQRGDSGDNYSGTIFDDAAPVLIANGTAPFSGAFKPEQALAKLVGKPLNGVWKLEVHDAYAGDGGELTGFSLELQKGIANCQFPASNLLLVERGAVQDSTINHTFPIAPGVQLANPASGIGVVFTVETSPEGATATFADGSTTYNTVTDARGQAVAPTLTANGQAGRYKVRITAGNKLAELLLTNRVTGECAVVTRAEDTGYGELCGTLSYILRQPVKAPTIVNFNLAPYNTINFQAIPPGGLVVPAGLTIQGESCANPITLNGSQQNGDGLVLKGNARLTNLQIGNFGSRQLVQNSPTLNVRCVVVRTKF